MQPQSQLAQDAWSLLDEGLQRMEASGMAAMNLLGYSSDSPDAESMKALLALVQNSVPHVRRMATEALNGNAGERDQHESTGDGGGEDAGGEDQAADEPGVDAG